MATHSPVPHVLPTLRGCLLFKVEEVLGGLLELGQEELGGEPSLLPVSDTSLGERRWSRRGEGGETEW